MSPIANIVRRIMLYVVYPVAVLIDLWGYNLENTTRLYEGSKVVVQASQVSPLPRYVAG